VPTVTVLVVDDDSRTARQARMSLAGAGFSVEIVGSSEAAIRLLHDALPDLVVLNLFLPGTESWEVFYYLRAKGSIPLIILADRPRYGEALLALDRGADDSLSTPFEPRELVARSRAVLRRYRDKDVDWA